MNEPLSSGPAQGPAPRTGDALLLVDVQHDFLPGGSLAVPQGDRVLVPLQRCLAVFARQGLPVFASRDWHPGDHCSFRDQGGPWPPHCVAGSAGAAFPAALALPSGAAIVSKGCQAQHEAYSAFAGTDLSARLKAAGVRRVFVGGLATDYCVLSTVLDARALGFEVVVLRDAVAAVDVQPGDGDKALDAMASAGAEIRDSAQALV
jgi:nicotinamidase/pyrazinamidase